MELMLAGGLALIILFAVVVAVASAVTSVSVAATLGGDDEE